MKTNKGFGSIAEALQKRGFNFETRQQLSDFVSKNCTAELDKKLKCTNYFLNYELFFVSYHKIDQ